MNIPRISKNDTLPIYVRLRAEGQPLHGLAVSNSSPRRRYYERGNEYTVHISNRKNTRDEVIGYNVVTIGATRSTRREKTFTRIEEAVAHANEWIVRIVAAGSSKMVTQQVEKVESQRRRREALLETIEKAGGPDLYKSQLINKEKGYAIKRTIDIKDSLTVLALWNAGSHALPADVRQDMEKRINEWMEYAASRLNTELAQIDAVMAEEI